MYRCLLRPVYGQISLRTHPSSIRRLTSMAKLLPNHVRIVEVGPRDGLQNISTPIPTATKISLIQRLHEAGLRAIEVTSAVSPKAVPQLADNQEVLAHHTIKDLIRQEGLQLPVLVPNRKGLELTIKHGVKEVAVFVSATEGFSRANTKCSVEEGLQRAREVAEISRKEGILVRGCVKTLTNINTRDAILTTYLDTYHVYSMTHMTDQHLKQRYSTESNNS